MKEYFKVVLKNLIDIVKSVVIATIVMIYVGLISYLIYKSLWMLIPIIIITILLGCLVYSKFEDKTMKYYFSNVKFVSFVLGLSLGILACFIGILALIIWLLSISFLFLIPIFIIGLLICSYVKYKKETK